MQQKSTLTLLVACLGVTTLFAQPGYLDNSFAGNGLLRTLLGTSCDAADVKVQSNGKIVVAGAYTTAQGIINFLVERYNADGTFDNTFAGGDGEQGIAIGIESSAFSVAFQSDGKIVACGYSYDAQYQPYVVIVRLNSNGTLDNSFGTGGKLLIPNVGAGNINSVAILASGKIIVAQPGYSGANARLCAIRINSNGTLDNTFGTNGISTVLLASSLVESARMVIQPDGKMVIACKHVIIYVDHSIYDAAVVRLKTDGSLDSSFGTGGIVYQQVGGYNVTGATCVALQADNKIVVGGYYNTPASRFLVMRFNTNGTLDNTFAGNGRTGIAFSQPSAAEGIAVDNSGRIVVGGYIQSSSDADFALARLMQDGTLDTYFGSAGNGKVTTGLGYADRARALTIQPDGKILLAGISGNDIGLARYQVVVKVLPSQRLLPGSLSPDSAQPIKRRSLYPNPAGNVMILDGLDPQAITQYNITDALGKTIQTNRILFRSNTQINTSNVAAGSYFIQIISNGKAQTLRFIKKQ